MNRRLEPRIETVFMMPAEAYSYLSSRLVREVFKLGGSVEGLVPPLVQQKLSEKMKARNPGRKSLLKITSSSPQLRRGKPGQ